MNDLLTAPPLQKETQALLDTREVKAPLSRHAYDAGPSPLKELYKNENISRSLELLELWS